MLAVANRFYRAEAGELVVLTVDEADLDVRWEAAEPDPATRHAGHDALPPRL